MRTIFNSRAAIALLPICALLSFQSRSQCTNQVTHVTGTSDVNGIAVTVTSSGVVAVNSDYCSLTLPYFIGYEYGGGTSGTGNYTFTFSPAVDGLTLNFSGTSNVTGNSEEVRLTVNGVHYAIPEAGPPNGCDPQAVLTEAGDLAGCTECSVSGWLGTTIPGPITSLVVEDYVIEGQPAGSIFSLFICSPTSVATADQPTVTNLIPNPFNDHFNIQTAFTTPVEVVLCDITGREVMRSIATRGEEVFVPQMPSGIYLCQVLHDGVTIFQSRMVKI